MRVLKAAISAARRHRRSKFSVPLSVIVWPPPIWTLTSPRSSAYAPECTVKPPEKIVEEVGVDVVPIWFRASDWPLVRVPAYDVDVLEALVAGQDTARRRTARRWAC